jgi:3-oxoacyl-[acyl-carrier-protein] synthase II
MNLVNGYNKKNTVMTIQQTRVVITGLGTINALGRDVNAFAQGLNEGRSGIGALTVFNPDGHMTDRAAEIRNFDSAASVPREFSRHRLSRADAFGIIAAVEALKDAGLYPPPKEIGREMGVIVGGGAGGLLAAESFYERYIRNESPLNWSELATVNCASTADHLTNGLNIYGPKTTFMTACSSGSTSLGFARDLIRSGSTRVVLAGGTEPICRMTYTAFNSLRAVDPEYCKPFDRHRRGLTLGEGSGFMVLEDLDYALARGADIKAEFLGYGLSADAHHMTAPDPEGRGAVQVMLAAINDAFLKPENIDYINAHGTGTPANDVSETRAIKTVMGSRAYRVPVSSTKSMIGHTLGAAGSIEAVACVIALTHGFIPPTIHLTEPDPECDLDYVTEGSRKMDSRVILSNSFAFGGNNTSIVLAAYEPYGVRE